MSSFTPFQVNQVGEFLQEYMRNHDIKSMTADQCANILADNNILPNNIGPKPGFNFRQMLRDGRDGKIPLVRGAYQSKPNTRWYIYRLD